MMQQHAPTAVVLQTVCFSSNALKKWLLENVAQDFSVQQISDSKTSARKDTKLDNYNRVSRRV
jgi:hypothetical protein